jgi:hypothetical protein
MLKLFNLLKGKTFMNDKKVSAFPGRKSAIASAVAGALTDQPAPTVGGSQGDFKREACGSCMSWRRVVRPGAPLNAGECMLFPPAPFPVMDESGRPIAQVLMRPQMTSEHEGCDQHDDGTEEDDGEVEPAPVLASTG